MSKQGDGYTRRNMLGLGAAVGIGFAAPWVWTSRKAAANAVPTVVDPRFSAPVINPLAIPKFRSPLPTPGPDWPVLGLTAAGSQQTIYLTQRNAWILPAGYPATPVWAYRTTSSNVAPGGVADATYLGPTILARSGNSINVTYDYSPLINSVNGTTKHILRRGTSPGQSVVDKHVHGTDTPPPNQEPQVRFVAHLHGGVGVAADSDGYAEAWVTPSGDQGTTPPGTRPVTSGGTQTHTYMNMEGAALAWYHDHALGITRLNVHAGMAAGYLITDDNEQRLINAGSVPTLDGASHVPLVIQDRMFYPDGTIAYPDLSATAAGLIVGPGPCERWNNNDVSTLPEYFGDVVVVNGVAWPSLTVAPGWYRLRFLNGCDSRFLQLSLDKGAKFLVLGTEGGFLPAAVELDELLMGPAERFDVLVDFTPHAGQTLTLTNEGNKPFPTGTPPNPRTDGLVMQFNVVGTNPPFRTNLVAGSALYTTPPPTPGSKRATHTRRVLLFETRDAFGRIQPVLGTVSGSTAPFTATPLLWDDRVTERPAAGTVEIWEIYNTTVDTHPIHIHEVLFSVINRQGISFDNTVVDGVSCTSPRPTFDISLSGATKPAPLYERGFKDTVKAGPGEVTRVKVDFSTAKPGRFVWHCHILEHEDHEMMRPYEVT